MTKVVKRDGREVEWDSRLIFNAVNKAAKAAGMLDQDAHSFAEVTRSKVVSHIKKEKVSVDEIQDMVEKSLMGSKWKNVAKEYIQFRHDRDMARKVKTKDVFMSIIGAKSNLVTRENANMNADTPAGMMMKFASETTKEFVDDYLLSDNIKNAVENGYIYPHDKDFYPTKSLTCLQHPLDRILKNGFRAGHGSSRPAKRIETASIIGCISMETIQNEMHGGQAIPAFDFYMAPYVRLSYIEEVKKIEELYHADLSEIYQAEITDYEEKPINGTDVLQRSKQAAINNTVRRVHQALEAFIHNMNTIHSRGGNQVVFSSINYGTDTSAEGRCVIRELLRSTYQGVGNGETPIFPIQIWKKKRGVNFLPEDPNYDLYELACEVTAKRFFPNFINLDATFNQHEKWDVTDPQRYVYEAATMGCRTRVFENVNGEKTSIGRGNLSFTSIDLPKLAVESALEAKEYLGEEPTIGRGMKITPKYLKLALKYFKDKIKTYCDLSCIQLKERFDFQSTAYAKQFPLLMSGMWNGSEKLKPMDQVGEVLKQGSLSIGFIGLAEALIALTGKHHGEDPLSQEIGIDVITEMRDLCKGYTETYGLNFSVLGTPAEGLSGKFTGWDKETFGVIDGVTDKDYYTNSSHVPVYYKCTAQHKAQIEAPYHELELAGHIFYVELDGDATHNPSSVKNIVNLMDKYNIGYGSVNHVRSRCLSCGFENSDANLKVCPECGSDAIDTIERITGYLVGTTDRWNSSKLAELHDRVTHGTGEI